ncbi:MAG: ribosome recycling factor [Proteobacteria bacterium]|nr:ribosome recycling factor [Pseudomonadota bacterium]
MDSVIKEARAKMDRSIDSYQVELSKLRTGRATVTIFEDVKADYYGTPTPITQMANISAPEPRLINIQPFDISQLGAIEKAIIQSDLGLTPSNDGKLIRISIPALTEERRKELVKIARKYSEECKVSIRNSRRDANDLFKDMEKEKLITQDDLKKGQGDTQTLTDSEIAKIEKILVAKEAEVMEI